MEDLAEHREHEARLAERRRKDGVEERSKDLPDDIPTKAIVMIKEINDNRYYWQWRDSDKIRSKYKGPVNSDE